MATAQRKIPTHMTAAEFVAWSGDGMGGRYQLIDGEVRAMSPASTTHGTIQSTLARLIGNTLVGAGHRCRSLTEPAIEVRVQSDINTRVPDIGVSCAPDIAGQIFLPEPILLVEILSPTSKKDTWANVWAYTTIPSMQEILVVHLTRILAEVLRRQSDGSWARNTTKISRDDTLTLTSIDLATPMLDVYVNTHLARET